MLFGLGFRKAEAFEVIQNITIDDGGIAVWDEVSEASYYSVIVGSAYREVKVNQANVSDILKNAGAASGSYHIFITAFDRDGKALGEGISSDAYEYTSHGKLGTPYDPVWVDGYNARWLPVDDADYYLINIYKNGFLFDSTFALDCEADLSDYVIGIKDIFTYGVRAHTYGYEDSIESISKPKQGMDTTVLRISGKTRYDTSIEAAEYVKHHLYEGGSFPAVVITTGKNYPDALSGSYLAIQKGAPLLLIDESSAVKVTDYINQNLQEQGFVYVLGGEGAVKIEWLKNLDVNFHITMLYGPDRYATNIAILKEAEVWGNTTYLVCTGKGYADSLSCSALDLPIFLVGKSLTDSQLSYLDLIREEENSFIIIGGTGAVSEEVEKQLEEYGTVLKRISGKDRYETSVLIAREFFDKPHKLVLATGANFPDGLSGGPLASALEAPLILSKEGKESYARTYVYNLSIRNGYILGGPGAVSDALSDRVFHAGE